MPVCNVSSDWPRTFLHPMQVFLFSMFITCVCDSNNLMWLMCLSGNNSHEDYWNKANCVSISLKLLVYV